MLVQTTANNLLDRPLGPGAAVPEAKASVVLPRPALPLSRLKSPAVGRLMNGLDRDIKTLRRGRGQIGRLLLLTSLFFLSAHGRFLFGWECRDGVSALLLICCILLLQCLITRYASHLATRRRMKEELLLLQKYASAHRVDMLIDAMRYGDEEASCLAQRLLVETLPQVSEADAFSLAQHAALCRVLHGTNTGLILAVLTAFQRIGIPQSLRSVERMVWCPVWLADAQRIETAARACYVAIQERASRQAMTQTYLRPAVPNAARILLRPMSFERSSSDEFDVNHLVQASANGETKPL